MSGETLSWRTVPVDLMDQATAQSLADRYTAKSMQAEIRVPRRLDAREVPSGKVWRVRVLLPLEQRAVPILEDADSRTR